MIAKLSDNMTLFSTPPPGSGLLLAFMLRLLDGFVTAAPGPVEVVQRITEAFKHTYAHRTRLGDSAYYNIDQVSEHEGLQLAFPAHYCEAIGVSIKTNVYFLKKSYVLGKFKKYQFKSSFLCSSHANKTQGQHS